MAVDPEDVWRWVCDGCGFTELSENPPDEPPLNWAPISIQDASGGRSYEVCSRKCFRNLPVSVPVRSRGSGMILLAACVFSGLLGCLLFYLCFIRT